MHFGILVYFKDDFFENFELEILEVFKILEIIIILEIIDILDSLEILLFKSVTTIEAFGWKQKRQTTSLLEARSFTAIRA